MIQVLWFWGLALLSQEPTPNQLKVQKMYEGYQKQFDGLPQVSISSAKRDYQSQKLIFLDVREDKEIKVSRIKGAITKSDFEKNLHQYKDKKIAVYCTIGYRSAQYVRKLRKKNLKAFNLKGSFLGWLHSNGEIEDALGHSTNQAHVYGKNWDLAPQHIQTTYPNKAKRP